MEKMTPLRARMTEDMRVRGLGEKAQKALREDNTATSKSQIFSGFWF